MPSSPVFGVLGFLHWLHSFTREAEQGLKHTECRLVWGQAPPVLSEVECGGIWGHINIELSNLHKSSADALER